MTDHSQYGEATFIRNYFADRDQSKLRFLDVGAADGVSNSNTRALFDAGWSGVLVEPNPLLFSALMRNYHGEERATLVNAAITTAPGLIDFHVNTPDGIASDQLSCVTPAQRAKCEAYGYPFQTIMLAAIDWDQLVCRKPSVILADFVNIDVEGLNLEVFEAMPLKPEMVCIEAEPAERIEFEIWRRCRHARLIGGNWIGWELR